MTGKQRPHLRTLSVLAIGIAAVPWGCGPSAPRSTGFVASPAGPTRASASITPPPAAPAAPSAEPAPPPGPPPPPAEAVVLVEPIYKLGEASPLADVEAFNRGELGPLRGEPPPGPEHPLPRVVLEVPHCRGGHTAKAVEKAVREAFWGRAVGCYALDAFHDDELELDLTVEVQINRGGKVTSAKSASAKSEAKKGGAKKVAKESPSCIVRRLRLLQLPGAKRGSTARVRVRIWPGDDPLPPPSDRVVPGPGAIDPDAGHAAASATLPALEACYSEARSYAPELWGRLAVRLHVDEQGKVDEAFEVETTFPDEHLRRCALAALRKATFPAPAGGDVRVVVPLRFLPQGFDGVTSGSSTP